MWSKKKKREVVLMIRMRLGSVSVGDGGLLPSASLSLWNIHDNLIVFSRKKGNVKRLLSVVLDPYRQRWLSCSSLYYPYYDDVLMMIAVRWILQDYMNPVQSVHLPSLTHIWILETVESITIIHTWFFFLLHVYTPHKK